MDILEKLADLNQQATTEKSHYYVAGCVQEAGREIITLRQQRTDLIKALEGVASYINGASEQEWNIRVALAKAQG